MSKEQDTANLPARQPLKDCPFCGDILRIGTFKHPNRINYRLLCMSDDECFFMDFDTEAEAIEMGNRRAGEA